MKKLILLFTLTMVYSVILSGNDLIKNDNLSEYLQSLDVKKSGNQISKKIDHNINLSNFIDVNILEFNTNKQNSQLKQYVNEAIILDISNNGLKELIELKPNQINFKIPIGVNESVELLLMEVDISTDDFVVRGSSGSINQPLQRIHYQGIVKGNKNSMVALSVFENELNVFISDSKGNYLINTLPNQEDKHVFYNDRKLVNPPSFRCDSEGLNMEEKLYKEESDIVNKSVSSDNCVHIYFECDYELYQNLGSDLVSVEQFVSNLFNQISLVYDNENISVLISEVFVWETLDPYASETTSTDILKAFGETVQNSFNGDLAHFLSGRFLGGGVAFRNKLCAAYNDFYKSGPYAVSTSIFTNIVPFPAYSTNLLTTTHEIGHNLGSYHTHSCNWGVNGDEQIDDCGTIYVDPTEGANCYDAANPLLPSAGTIMSYCHFNNSIGIDFSLGFGPQPGDLIRMRVNEASCLGVCSGSEVYGCTDLLACNYDANANTDDGTCNYAPTYYDCNGNCISDIDSDGICDELETFGCTDLLACNYDANATSDDGTCNYAPIYYDCNGNCISDIDSDGICDELETLGCTDLLACNYDANATSDDGTCNYAPTYYDCNGNCISDIDSDGICDELETLGCTDPTATNYDSTATEDDGTCNYSNFSCQENVYLYSQQDVVDFGAILCDTIYGDLYINNVGAGLSDINDLSPLSSLVKVEGFISIIKNPLLADFTGFNNLLCTENLLIEDNESLLNLEGLNSLNSVGTLMIENNESLNDLSALQNITNIQGTLSIFNNDNLINLTGLENITNVSGPINIEFCENLVDIDALQNIITLGGLFLNDIPIQDVSVFSSISVINGNLGISQCDELLNLNGFSSMTELKGSLSINNCDLITSLAGLENILSIEKYISITDNSNLTDLNALQNIQTIINTSAITNSITSIDIISNNSLTNFSGFPNITEVDKIRISNNNALEEFPSFENLQSLQYLFVNGNSQLSTCCNLVDLIDITTETVQVEDNNIGCSSVSEVQGQNCSTCDNPIVIIDQPGNQTICESQDVTFSVTASGGNGDFNYQWQQICQENEGNWTNYSLGVSGFPCSTDIIALEVTDEGSIYIGDLFSNCGVGYYNHANSTWSDYNTNTSNPGNFPNDRVRDIILSEDGTLYVATDVFTSGGGGIAILPSGASSWTVYDSSTANPSGLPDGNVYDLDVGEDGTIYASVFSSNGAFSTGINLCILKPGATSWIIYNGYDNSASTGLTNDIFGFYFDLSSNGNLYMSLNGGGIGIYNTVTETWTETTDNGLGGGTAYYDDHTGTLYSFGGDGLYYLTSNASSWEVYNQSTTSGLPSEHFRSLHISSDGTIYAGLQGEGLVVLSPGSTNWINYNISNSDILSNSVWKIYFNELNQHLYLGTGNGVSILESDILNVGTNSPNYTFTPSLPQDTTCTYKVIVSDSNGCLVSSQQASLTFTPIGTPCNDGNANTINDIIQSDCSCIGTQTSTPQPNWDTVTPNNQSGQFRGQAQIDGLPAEQGDWLAAFDSDGNIAGADQFTFNAGIAYINMYIYGDDPTTPGIDEGINNGEYFTLQLFDASENAYYDYTFNGQIVEFTEWENNNGIPMMAYSNSNDIYNFLSTQLCEQTINLNQGWNLISLDLSPSDSSIPVVFGGLQSGNLEYVTGFEGGVLTYNPNDPPFLNTLTDLVDGSAYWVRVQNADVLLVAGTCLEDTYRKPLNNGWNLIAYIPDNPQSPSSYFADLISNGDLQYVTGFYNGTFIFNPNDPPFLNTLQQMENGLGYWLKVVNQ